MSKKNIVKVASSWENGWNVPLMEHHLWYFPLKEFNVDELIMEPISGINKKVTEVESIQAAIDANPDLTPVYLDENGETSLKEFDHPYDVLYICGRAGYSPWKAHGSKGISIKIETPTDSGRIWGHQAMVLVLYDRESKK